MFIIRQHKRAFMALKEVEIMKFGKIINYLALGGLVSVLPGVISNFLPNFTGVKLGIGLIAGSLFAVGFKIPYLAPALGVGNMVSGFGSATSTTSGVVA